MSVTYINGVPCIQGGLQLRKLAALKPTTAELGHFNLRRFSELQAVDPSSWAPCDLSSFGSPIRDQGQHGSCTGHAGVAALDIVRRQNGDIPVLLSCTFPYSLVNGNRDNGASVSSILQVLEQTGTCTFAECGTDQIFQSQYAKSCFDTAKKYQAIQSFTVHTFEELCAAVNIGFPVAFGIQVGNNFSKLDSEGVCPPPIMTVGGHALCAIGLKRGKNGDWLVKFQNSWSAQWGLQGYAFLSRGSFANMIDAYAITYAKNTNGPPPAVVTTKRPDLLDGLREQVIKEITAEEDAKVLAAINKKIEEAPKEESVTVVPKEESLTAQIEAPIKPRRRRHK